jgi:transposase
MRHRLESRLDELEAIRAEKMASTFATPTAAPVNQTAKRARQPLPPHLPRETRKVLPKQEACPDCGGKLKQLGETLCATAIPQRRLSFTRNRQWK